MNTRRALAIAVGLTIGALAIGGTSADPRKAPAPVADGSGAGSGSGSAVTPPSKPTAKTGPHCVKGCPCGNSCISCKKSCNVGPNVGPGTAWK